MELYKSILALALCLCSLTFCSEKEEIVMSEYEYADYVISEIICSLDENDNERLKSLFSNSVTETVDDLDTQCDIFSDFIGSKIVSHEYDETIASDGSVENGEKSNMIRFSFDIVTEENEKYGIFVICYNTDTANPDNVGVYMIEIARADYDEYDAWQDRMVPGISILE